MEISDLLTATKLHCRVDHDDEDGALLLMLSAAALDVCGAAGIEIPGDAADLPDDLRLAVMDQAAMLYDARGGDTKRPLGLSLAAARITARHRGVRACQPVQP